MPGLALLDRDGVLNRMVVDAEHGTIDSPLHPSQVELYPFVPDALAAIGRAGFGLVIVSNQPAAAKGKTTRQNLIAVHERVVAEAQQNGAVILSSHLCFHRQEDGCDCRKPRTGLLAAAFARHPEYTPAASFMIGDGVTDVEAGRAFAVRTAFLSPPRCEACRIFKERGLAPDFWGTDLRDFAHALETQSLERL